MHCWICGADGDSREHLIKASDLRGVFGRNVTQKAPLYIHTSERKNRPVGGIKSDLLKFSTRICRSCNNQRTQPHDRAWEQFSSYLRGRQPPLRKGSIVRLADVFPGSVRSSMMDVHLFFLKQFGCLIAEYSIPLDLSAFARAICSNSAHPLVRIGVWTGFAGSVRKHAARTVVQTAMLDGCVVYAGWFYFVDQIAINVMYALPTEHRKGLVHSWHPNTVGKILHIAGL